MGRENRGGLPELGAGIVNLGFGCDRPPMSRTCSKIVRDKDDRPNRQARGEERGAPDFGESLDGVFRFGLSRGVLSDALLGPLGLLTGRRIGLLAFMQRENISRRNGVWLVKPSRVVVREDGTEMGGALQDEGIDERLTSCTTSSPNAASSIGRSAPTAPFSRFPDAGTGPGRRRAEAHEARLQRFRSRPGAVGNLPLAAARQHPQGERPGRGRKCHSWPGGGHARTKDPHSGYAPGLTPQTSS